MAEKKGLHLGAWFRRREDSRECKKRISGDEPSDEKLATSFIIIGTRHVKTVYSTGGERGKH